MVILTAVTATTSEHEICTHPSDFSPAFAVIDLTEAKKRQKIDAIRDVLGTVVGNFPCDDRSRVIVTDPIQPALHSALDFELGLLGFELIDDEDEYWALHGLPRPAAVMQCFGAGKGYETVLSGWTPRSPSRSGPNNKQERDDEVSWMCLPGQQRLIADISGFHFEFEHVNHVKTRTMTIPWHVLDAPHVYVAT